MNKARITVVLLLGITLVSGLSCDRAGVSTSTPTPATTPIVTDYISLIDNLRGAGATVVNTGEVAQQPCFSVDAKVITVNGSDVQVFEYEDAAATDTEAALISPHGFSINKTSNDNGQICNISWIASPHFYKASNLIVLYIGENQTVIDVLKSVLGPQFAGSAEND